MNELARLTIKEVAIMSALDELALIDAESLVPLRETCKYTLCMLQTYPTITLDRLTKAEMVADACVYTSIGLFTLLAYGEAPKDSLSLAGAMLEKALGNVQNQIQKTYKRK